MIEIPDDLRAEYEYAKGCSHSTGFLAPIGQAFMAYIERIAALTEERDQLKAQLDAITADRNLYRDDRDEAGHPYSEVVALRAQLAALDWRPITEQDLPKVGDEVRRRPDSDAVIKHNNPQILAVTESMVTLFGWQTEKDELWKEQSWIEFRPNGKEQDNGK